MPKEPRGHMGSEPQKEVDKAYIEESLYNKVLRVLQKGDWNVHNPAGQSELARAIARKLADSILDEEFAALSKKS